ncbi:response regulator [Methyloversatilis thermotolerans]|uniref:response regulator n=1 Tax=Methyloversatilis thermotolerans TaxID=1346290 RepID=UPI0003602EC1|nr:response regulator [Methyloversatilis thermotolerans]
MMREANVQGSGALAWDALALYRDAATLWSNDLWRAAAAAGSCWHPAEPGWRGDPGHLDLWVQQCLRGGASLLLRSVSWVEAVWRLSVEPLCEGRDGWMVHLQPEVFSPRHAQDRAVSLLAVDDEAYILNALRRLLRRSGFDLRTAGSADEAWDMLQQQPADIVLSDQRMPGTTGVQLLARVRDHAPDTVRIILSGYSDAQSITDAINEGAVYKFIAKPWDDAQLLLTLNEAADVFRTRMQTRQLQLALATANAELGSANQRLKTLLSEQDHHISIGDYALRLAQDLNDALPFPVIGLDAEGQLVTANDAAARYLGVSAADGSLAALVRGQQDSFRRGFEFAGRQWCLCIGLLGGGAGRVIALMPESGHEL